MYSKGQSWPDDVDRLEVRHFRGFNEYKSVAAIIINFRPINISLSVRYVNSHHPCFLSSNLTLRNKDG